jgi:hypothetical protein
MGFAAFADTVQNDFDKETVNARLMTQETELQERLTQLGAAGGFRHTIRQKSS